MPDSESDKWCIEYHFCLLLDGFYSEFRAKKQAEKQSTWLNSLHLLLGVQTLLHVYRVGWSRGYAIRPILVMCKNAQMYFFEYLTQWRNMGLPLRSSEMLVFIYDRVLEGPESKSVAWNPEWEPWLDHLSVVLHDLPSVDSKTTVHFFEKRLQQEVQV